MIDEKKLIERLENIQKNDCKSLMERVWFDGILAIVETQPKVGEWIPVEEGLPKVGQDILATCSNGEVDAGFYGWNDDWNLDYIDIEAHPVIAWMPFPEQYRKEDNK